MGMRMEKEVGKTMGNAMRDEMRERAGWPQVHGSSDEKGNGTVDREGDARQKLDSGTFNFGLGSWGFIRFAASLRFDSGSLDSLQPRRNSL
jgi:hypothetical protein